jgi:hypothetical protein
MRCVVRCADDPRGSSFQESMAPAANHEGDKPLGELIARSGLVASNDLYAALATSRATRRRLGDVLLEKGLIGERDLAQIVAEQEGLDFVDLGKFDLERKQSRSCRSGRPESTARSRFGRNALRPSSPSPIRPTTKASMRSSRRCPEGFASWSGPGARSTPPLPRRSGNVRPKAGRFPPHIGER